MNNSLSAVHAASRVAALHKQADLVSSLLAGVGANNAGSRLVEKPTPSGKGVIADLVDYAGRNTAKAQARREADREALLGQREQLSGDPDYPMGKERGTQINLDRIPQVDPYVQSITGQDSKAIPLWQQLMAVAPNPKKGVIGALASRKADRKSDLSAAGSGLPLADLGQKALDNPLPTAAVAGGGAAALVVLMHLLSRRGKKV